MFVAAFGLPKATFSPSEKGQGDVLYFLTIQSDKTGELRFQTNNGQWLIANGQSINYEADAHHGTLNAPIILTPSVKGQDDVLEKSLPYKVIEHERLIIIRDGKRYDVTGVTIE